MSFSLVFAGTIDTENDDGSDISWFDLNIDEFSLFPQRGEFTIADDTWNIEFFTLPGRFGDRFYMYLMKIIDGEYTPVVDMVLNERVQIKVDNQIRVYGEAVVPMLEDVYLTDTSTGTYKVLVSEIV